MKPSGNIAGVVVGVGVGVASGVEVGAGVGVTTGVGVGVGATVGLGVEVGVGVAAWRQKRFRKRKITMPAIRGEKRCGGVM
jgi:hypothetical protein